MLSAIIFKAPSTSVGVNLLMSGPNESQTRKLYIDKALAHAGWDVTNTEQVAKVHVVVQ